ncbi:SigE family RNA polymerase sigma factor [Spongiactinospora sp. TRM90649]|uniref:SigE family RNA polymerase sigma factor n=1 Tax=Spongiactinospora sp. TRM90649 TaxID=3031114 RepID=UPI0023F83826|nr:SigE family RNA polymerase sigma factor [Spongiactinospora sp. TRM90649]MDF5753053.1 SigE family RNA polymerase sigma factor [Spongiactinospora sp. TRM90649]
MRPHYVEFEQFVRARGGALYRYGFVLTGNADDADDLVQEALLRLEGAWARVRKKDDPEGYVRTIMARQHVSWWRRTRREDLTSEVPEVGYRDLRFERVEESAGSALWQELRALPRKQRTVLVLRYYQDLSDDEIAATLGISAGTVRSQASRALSKLRVRRPSRAAFLSDITCGDIAGVSDTGSRS